VAMLRTVNGDVRIQDVDGELDAQSVNGNVEVRGARRAVRAQTVNGRLDVAAAAVVSGGGIELKTVSGSVLLTLPKDARFDLSASTMNGTIGSTFPLAPRDDASMDAAEDARRTPRARTPRPSRRVVVQRDGEDVVVDVPELERALEESMKEVDSEIRESLRDADRESTRMKVLMPGGQYRGSSGSPQARARRTRRPSSRGVRSSSPFRRWTCGFRPRGFRSAFRRSGSVLLASPTRPARRKRKSSCRRRDPSCGATSRETFSLPRGRAPTRSVTSPAGPSS
jgi:hypothetical protein